LSALTSEKSDVQHKVTSRSGHLLLLLAFIIVGMIVGNGLSLLVWSVGGIDMTEVLGGAPLESNQRNTFRLGLLINHISTFIIPGIIYCFYFVKEDVRSFLQWSLSIPVRSLILWGLVTLCSYPLIALLTQWNTSMNLPQWLSSSQDDAFALLSQTLQMDSWPEYLLAFLLVGVSAAIGEELIFRGIVQRNLVRKIENPHIAILIAAVLFGGFHLQFERFLPLAFLGLVLGYSYHYSKNILVPILIHLANNSLQLTAVFITIRHGQMPDIEAIPSIPIYAAIGSVLLTVWLSYMAIRSSQIKYESRP